MEQNEHSKYEDPKKRAEIGKMSGLIGIACNFLLAGSKIAVGNFAGSTSIVADGLNNMSDAASSAVTLIGFKLAEKPADREHPSGCFCNDFGDWSGIGTEVRGKDKKSDSGGIFVCDTCRSGVFDSNEKWHGSI